MTPVSLSISWDKLSKFEVRLNLDYSQQAPDRRDRLLRVIQEKGCLVMGLEMYL